MLLSCGWYGETLGKYYGYYFNYTTETTQEQSCTELYNIIVSYPFIQSPTLHGAVSVSKERIVILAHLMIIIL